MKELKKTFSLLIVIWMVHALVSFEFICHAQDKYIVKNQSHKRSFIGSWDEKKSTEIIANICKRWTYNKNIEDYSIKKSLSFNRDGIQKRFVQISRNGESCHFCPGLIGAVIFSENNNHWEVEFEDETFAKFGCYGVPPKAKLIKIGSDRYGLLFQWARNEQGGGYVHYVALIDLGDKKYTLILREELYQKEISPKPVTPMVKVATTNNRDFYNIKIKSKIYKYREGKYRVIDQ